MAYREVTMIEIKEVLRRWVSGIPKKRLAAQLGLDPKTVRRYVGEAEKCGVRLQDGLAGLTDELEKEGLVSRQASPGDRRAYVLQLTPARTLKGVRLVDPRALEVDPSKARWWYASASDAGPPLEPEVGDTVGAVALDLLEPEVSRQVGLVVPDREPLSPISLALFSMQFPGFSDG